MILQNHNPNTWIFSSDFESHTLMYVFQVCIERIVDQSIRSMYNAMNLKKGATALGLLFMPIICGNGIHSYMLTLILPLLQNTKAFHVFVCKQKKCLH